MMNKRLLKLILVSGGFALNSIVGGVATAQPAFDHLACYTIKDTNARTDYTLDLTPEQTQFLQETGCAIKAQSKYMCIDVQKTNVQPPPPLSTSGSNARDYLCYQLKCPRVTNAKQVLAEDQFGLRRVYPGGAYMMCAPAEKPCAPLPTSIVGWWPLDETTGTTVADIVGGNDGTAMPSGIGIGGPTSELGGFVNTSLNFDGSTQFIEVGNPNALNLGATFTIDAWVRPTTNKACTGAGAPFACCTGAGTGTCIGDKGVRPIVDKRDTTPVGYELALYNGKLMFQMADGSGSSCVCSSNFSTHRCTNWGGGPNLADGNWHHVTVTVDPTVGHLYVDGNPAGSPFTPRPGSLSNLTDLRIGRTNLNPCGSDLFWQGDIDEVEIFNEALSQTEVTVIAAAGTKGKCKCPAAQSINIATGQFSTPVGNPDPLPWRLTAAPVGTVAFAIPGPAMVIDKNSGWTGLAGTQWVSANRTCTNVLTAECPGGDYSYELCWQQCGSAAISLQVLADNNAQVFLNGAQIGATPSNGYAAPTSVTVPDPGPGSRNCLRIDVHNNPYSGGGGDGDGT